MCGDETRVPLLKLPPVRAACHSGFILVPVLASALATVVYSYYAFRKEQE